MNGVSHPDLKKKPGSPDEFKKTPWEQTMSKRVAADDFDNNDVKKLKFDSASDESSDDSSWAPSSDEDEAEVIDDQCVTRSKGKAPPTGDDVNTVMDQVDEEVDNESDLSSDTEEESEEDDEEEDDDEEDDDEEDDEYSDDDSFVSSNESAQEEDAPSAQEEDAPEDIPVLVRSHSGLC